MSQNLDRPFDAIADLLLRELRSAVDARLAGGGDAWEMAVDLTERVRRIRRMGGADPAVSERG